MGQKLKPISVIRLLIGVNCNAIRLEKVGGDFFFFIPKLEVLELLNVSIIGTAANYLGRARWRQRIGILETASDDTILKHHIRDEIEFERSNVAQLPFQLSAICITVLRFGIFNASYIGDDQARLKFRRDCKGLKYFRRYLIIQQIPLKGSRKRSLTSAMNAPKWIFFFCFRRAIFKSIFG